MKSRSPSLAASHNAPSFSFTLATVPSPSISNTACAAGTPTVSTKYVHTSAAVDAIASDAADAIEAATRHRGVATLAVPHDLTWSRVLDSGRLSDAIARAENVRNRRDGAEDVVVTDAVRAFLREMLARAKPLARGEVLFYIGGDACGEEELRIVGDVAEALGADVVCECFFSCIERGGDMPKV